MEYERLKTAAETITMPDEMKRRIAGNCEAKVRKERIMKTNRNIRKPAIALIALMLCISLSVTVVAASGKREGYFRDITNWQGAVVGTSYEQASDEIDMRVAVNGNELTVLASFSVPQEPPYREVEKLGIAAYRIVNANSKVVKEGTAESTEVINGQAAISIKLDDIDSGNYKLVVAAFVGEKKAEQPLNINGSWECAFTK